MNIRAFDYRACWNGYSPLAHLRQKFERCDAHWHRPKRADWRAKAYERSAQYRVDPLAIINGRGAQLFPVTRADACAQCHFDHIKHPCRSEAK